MKLGMLLLSILSQLPHNASSMMAAVIAKNFVFFIS
jgi:hypothetical protein